MPIALNSEERVRAELVRQLGHPPAPDLWEQLVADGWVEEVALVDSPRDARERARRVVRLAAEYRNLEGTALPEALPVRGDGNGKALALARIVHEQASREAEVVAFRDEVLHGALLPADEVHDWIAARLTEEEQARFVADLERLVKRHGGDRMTVLDFVGGFLLEYAVPADEWVHRRRVHPVGALARLRKLSDQLAHSYGWHHAWATTFVLTGILVPQTLAIVTEREAVMPALERILLEVSPRVSPTEVRDLYAEVRARRRGTHYRDRELADETLALAVFVAENYRAAASWADLHRAWAKLGRDPTFSDWKQFTIAARRAYERVTGAPLAWRERGGKEGKQ